MHPEVIFKSSYNFNIEYLNINVGIISQITEGGFTSAARGSSLVPEYH